MASTFVPHPRTATATVCSTSSLLLLGFTLSRSLNFYCSKRLLGRNNTATTSAPHERCQHLLRGALLLSYSVTNSRLFCASSYRLCWYLPDNWHTHAKTLHHDTATINSEFIFSNLTDQFNNLFKKFVLPNSGRTWDARLFSLFFWSPFVVCFSQPTPCYQVTCLRNSHHEHFDTLSWTSSHL